ncbi:hypothetical protein EG347_11530 [Chryseobacterium sp. G0186]|uniref:hypothetical protein n=1 Tax=Chryseobacterium sp. G0186 TaxID=2487064 RepID=UPI000F4F4F17|nr:hypothetical protein [Chryseobacterium sp. G0186]AZA78098.1 hypothetical protein EG347_11530 [Chryseobacterium sp. G0186]
MKKKLLLLVCIFLLSKIHSQVGIDTSTPHQKTVLDVVSKTNNTGVLFPRLTTSEIASINPTVGDITVNGLWVYNTDTKCYNYWGAASQNQWMQICGTPVTAGSAVLNCTGATSTGTLVSGQAANGVSVTVPYTTGNGGPYAPQSISSTGVTGLTANITAGNFNNGSGNLVFNVSGLPSGSGTAIFAINMGGSACSVSVNVDPTPGQAVLNCNGTTTSGTLVANMAANAVSFTIPYTAGNGGPYTAQNIASSGVTGLTASLPAGNFNNGSGNLVFSVSGAPSGSGTAVFSIVIAGQTCNVSMTVQAAIGTFNNPAPSCQAIFDKYNSSSVLVANDGEYWIGTSFIDKYKTRCDMVDTTEALALKKIVGGYTLLWSYSEATATADGAWGTNGLLNWSNTALDNRNVVTAPNGTINYNDFRITSMEKSRWANNAVRQTFTDEPTNSNKSLQTYLNYPQSGIIDGGQDFRNVGIGTVSGKYLGGDFFVMKNTSGDRATLYIDGIMIQNNIYFYNSSYNTHWDNTTYRYSPTINGGNGAVISNFPLWVVNEWSSEMPFGKCRTTSSYTAPAPLGGGYPSKTFTDACQPNNSTMNRHFGINGTQGYVMQWWAK